MSQNPYDSPQQGPYGQQQPFITPRRYALEHRGGMILAFGIVALVACAPIFGPMAWAMGNTDLHEMRRGRMDPEGRGLTEAGRVMGIIGTILGIIQICFLLLGLCLLAGARVG